jgi:PII-like signaling protein
MEGIVLQTVKGYYYKGKIELEEDIKIKKKVPVLVTFLKEGGSESLSAIERMLRRKPIEISPDKVVDLIAKGRR